MEKLKITYERLSYHSKVKLIFYSIFFTIAIFVTILGIFFARVVSTEIYERNQEKLAVNSINIENELRHIEQLITEIHQNSSLQEKIEYLQQQDILFTDRTKVLFELKNELNWLLSSKEYIKKVVFLDADSIQINNEAITDEEKAQLAAQLSTDERTGKWLFSEDLEEGIYIKNIFTVRKSSFKQLARVAIFVNTSFIKEHLMNTELFSTKDFLVLRTAEDQYYTTEIPLPSMEAATKIIEQRFPNFKSKYQHSFESLGKDKYFVYNSNIRTTSSNFQLYYFMLNSQIVNQLIQLLTIFIVVCILLLVTGLKLASHYLDRLLGPIQLLAADMTRFQNKDDFKHLNDFDDFQFYKNREDEIGVLFNSYASLIRKIEEMIIKDYQSKLLNQEMEYKFLRAQLDPHFLYNTLNSINSLALYKEETEISEMVTSLALLLRKKINQEQVFHSVKSEMEIVEAYINIQKIRFKKRLIYTVEIDDKSLSVEIPQLCIQPIIENSIKYAVEQMDCPVTILLNITVIDESIFIEIMDNGPGFTESKLTKRQSTGVGISNIRTRLAILYGQEAELIITSIPMVETKVCLIIPIDHTKKTEEK